MAQATSITIAGKTFSVPQPFDEGHVLNANQAAALNQVFSENIRNNFAKKVKDATETGAFDQDAMQSSLNDYASNYQFGVRTGGFRTADPVEREAMEIARGRVRDAIQKKGHKLADYSAAKITALAEQVLEKYPEIRDVAKARVEAAANAADVELDSLDLSAAESEAAPSKRGKKADAPAE